MGKHKHEFPSKAQRAVSEEPGGTKKKKQKTKDRGTRDTDAAVGFSVFSVRESEDVGRPLR